MEFIECHQTPTLRAENPSAAQRVRRAVCLLNAAQYDEAIALLESHWNETGTDDPLEFYLASLINERPEVNAGDRSLPALRQQIAVDPENPELHFQLGARLALAHRLDEAELRFTQVLSIARDHVDALTCLALCHQIRGDLDMGITLLHRAQSLRPSDGRVTLLLARAVKLCHEQGEKLDLCAAVSND